MVDKIVPILNKASSSVNPLDAYVTHTKLIPPVSRGEILDRLVVFHKLGIRKPAPLTLLHAPAGYGKTTLVLSWLKYLSVKTAWYSLDEDDNESSRFLLYLIASIQTKFHNFSNIVVPNLITPQSTNIQHSITQIINNIARIDDELVVVLDDYHRIDSAEVQQIVKTLIDLSPPNFHLCIVTRSKPALPLAKLRVRNKLVEITKEDIRFNAIDARLFFRSIMHLKELKDSQIETLIDKTEGWIAGMQLAAIGFREHQNYEDLIEIFSGRNHLVEDYFVDELLSSADENTRKFLLFTSILSRFNAQLCREILPEIDASEMLNKLERLGYFILPLDYTREWYRYHHLFSAVLQHKLDEKYPECIAVLHKIASLWYERHELYDDAFRHACSEDTLDHATRLFEKCFWKNVINGRFSDSYRWLKIIPISQFENNANLAILYAWCLFTARGTYEIEWIERADKLLESFSETENKDDVLANINMLRAFNACRVRDIPRSIEYAETLIQTEVGKNVARHNIALTVLGTCHQALGGLSVAESYYTMAIKHAIEHRIISSFFPSIVGLSQLKLERGESRSAAQVIEIGFNAAKRFSWESLSNMAWLFLGQGEIEFQKANYTKSLEYYGEAHQLSQSQLRNMVRHFIALRMASIYTLLGNNDLATSYLDEAMSEPYNSPLTPIISDFEPLLSGVLVQFGYFAKAEERLLGEQGKHNAEIDVANRQVLIALVNILLNRRQYERALAMLVPMIREFESRGMKEPLVRSFILLAIAKRGIGNINSAYDQMENALAIASYSTIVGPFVEYKELTQWYFERASEDKLASEINNPGFIKAVFSYQATVSATSDGVSTTDSFYATTLSTKEQETLKWLANGMSNPEISEKMHVSVNTIKTHLKKIYEKMGVRTRTAAIKKAIDAGLFEE